MADYNPPFNQTPMEAEVHNWPAPQDRYAHTSCCTCGAGFFGPKRAFYCHLCSVEITKPVVLLQELPFKEAPDTPRDLAMKWPHHKDIAGKPHWNIDLMPMMAALASVEKERWWIADPALKYLTIRLDTRDNAFLVFIDGEKDGADKERIDPQRVIDAIEKYKATWMPRKATA
jgi:hypothetical protein